MGDKRLNHLAIWDEFADIDPKFTKPITGKPYKGTSPNPQYVIRCLTEMFGPVGIGFGWKVVAEEFQPLGGEVLHWCRIEFWHTDRANIFDAYGQTKASYQTSAGKIMVDEDAPKKSLTDAIIKAASHIGIAANIFLGRWDDLKYVQDVNADYRAEERAAAGPTDAEIKADRDINDAIGHIETCHDIGELRSVFTGLSKHVQAIGAVIAAKDKRKSQFSQMGHDQ